MNPALDSALVVRKVIVTLLRVSCRKQPNLCWPKWSCWIVKLCNLRAFRFRLLWWGGSCCCRRGCREFSKSPQPIAFKRILRCSQRHQENAILSTAHSKTTQREPHPPGTKDLHRFTATIRHIVIMLDFLFPRTEKDILVQFAVALPDIAASSCCFVTEADRPRVLSLEQKEPSSSAFQSTTETGPMTRSEQNPSKTFNSKRCKGSRLWQRCHKMSRFSLNFPPNLYHMCEDGESLVFPPDSPLPIASRSAAVHEVPGQPAAQHGGPCLEDVFRIRKNGWE